MRFLGRWLYVVLLIAGLLGAPVPTNASGAGEVRLALVVTNQDYEHELIPLKYTHSDGDIVAAALLRIGFEVQVLRDGSKKALAAALTDFERRLRAAGPNAVAFFYFSGHCWATSTSNYLIMDERLPVPIGQMARGEQMRVLPQIGLPLKSVTDMIGRLEAKASFVVIDSHLDVAEPTLAQDVIRQRPEGRPHPGLVLAAQGRPGMPAADSNDFSKALAGALLTPGLTAGQIFTQVQVKVAEDSNGKQVPWYENHLRADYRFSEVPRVREPEQRASAPAVQRAVLPVDLEAQVDAAMWKAVANATSPELYHAYLAAYPAGRHVEEARRQLAELARAPRQSPAVTGAAPSRRVALVIGNAAYQSESRLKNPHNDAKAMANALRRIGFIEVVEAFDLSRTGLLAALRSFGEKASAADWAFVYYSGHGIEVDGANYLVPVDARLQSKSSVEDEAVALDRVLSLTSGARVAKVVVLDACRSNVFAGRWTGAGATKGGASKGFTPINASSGTLIAYAAEPGSTAADGEGELNPYAEALVRHLSERIDIRRVFGLVFDSLRERPQLRQTPWFSAALGGSEYVLRAD
jgi:uncharacterized caspase-like protein